MKTSYLIPFLSALSFGAAGACAPADDTAAEPECDVRYKDADGDRKGDPLDPTTDCAPGPGWVDNSDDCDDTNPYINADETEICDGVDNDCRATTAEADACTTQGCTPVVNPTTGTSYLFCAAPAVSDAALVRDVCNDHGFRFAQIEDQAEDEFLVAESRKFFELASRPLEDQAEDEFLVAESRKFFGPSPKRIVWLGGGHVDGVWRWADGTQFWPNPQTGSTAPYASWMEGEPRLRPGAVCMALAATSEPGWIAVPCVPARTVLCERDPADDTSAPPGDVPVPGQGCEVRYRDRDKDGAGDRSDWTTDCESSPDWVDNDGDCDDKNRHRNPSATEICDGLDNDCDDTTSEDEACAKQGCKPVVNPTTGTSYLFCAAPGESDAALARDVCNDHGFRFAQIEDRAENEFLVAESRQFFGPSAEPNVWLGGGYVKGVWRWADGTQFWPDPQTGSTAPYAGWMGGEPRLDPGEVCLALAATGEPGWIAVPCVPATTVLCERAPADDTSTPPGDVPVPGQGCAVRYRDLDKDGAGDRSDWTTACESSPDWVDNDDDCDDDNPHRNPSAAEICDGLDNDCNAETAETCADGCQPRVDAATGKRYLFCTTSQNWSTARDLCKAEDSHLAIIDNQAENAFLDNTGGSIQVGNWWIGAGDSLDGDSLNEGLWQWLDGTPFWSGRHDGGPVAGRYSHWAANEPNDDGDEDCGELLDDGTWNDNKCSASRRFICER